MSSYVRGRNAGMHNRVFFIKGAEYKAGVGIVKLKYIQATVTEKISSPQTVEMWKQREADARLCPPTTNQEPSDSHYQGHP